MSYLRFLYIIICLVTSTPNLCAQKVISGPKKIVKTESTNNKTVVPNSPRVIHKSDKSNNHLRTKKTQYRTNGNSQRVDYTRYNEGLVAAAERGDVKACHCLGHLYDQEYGYNGVIPDEEMAIKWYTLAANQGDYCAQIDLVFHCLNWPKNSKELDTVKKYAEMGNVCMQSSLGAYYMNKFYYSDAINWLQLAANNKNAQDESYNDNGYPAQVEAWFMIGKCYFEGLGTEKDIATGKMWMKKASNAGFQFATNYLEEHN